MRKIKYLNSLSMAGLAAGALALGACGGEGEGEGEGAEGATHVAGAAAGEGEGAQTSEGEGGEGEGEGAQTSEGEGGEGEGEGEGEGAADPVFNDIEYLYRIGLVRGHLAAFAELYQQGAYDMASTHAKHPGSEIYAELVPSFEARNQQGFADELRDLVAAAQAREPIDAAYEALKKKLRASAPPQSARDKLTAVSRLVRTAGEEFEIGVKNSGDIEYIHEYQDAYGFLIAAREFTEAVSATNDAEAAAKQTSLEQIDLALSQMAGLIVDHTDAKAEIIFGAAARIEIAALGLD